MPGCYARFVSREWYVGLPAALVGLVALARRAPQLALMLAAWAVLSGALLWSHSPLFGHHVVALVPPLAVLAGGLGALMEAPLSRSHARALVGTMLVGLVVIWGGISPELLAVRIKQPRQPMLEDAAEPCARSTRRTASC